MKTPIDVLILEDRQDDAELMVRELRRHDYAPQWRRVDTETAFVDALESPPDVILADHTLPQFGALRALQRVEERGLRVPVIVVSGTIGEETAVEYMKRGATDYLLKDRLARLGPAVERAMEKAHLRQDKDQALAQLKESEARFRRLAENLPDIIYRYRLHPSFAIDYLNGSVTQVTGYTPDAFYADPTLGIRIVHPDDRPRLEALLAGEVPDAPLTLRWFHKDGSLLWIEQRSVPVYDETGTVIAVEGVARDITARKHAEEHLQFQADILRNVRDSVIVTDAGGTIRYWNEGAREIFGYTADEMIGRTPAELYPDRNVDELQTDLEETLETGGRSRIWQGRRKDGSPVWIDVKTSPMYDADGTLTGFVGVSKDVTERVEQARELQQAKERFATAFQASPTASSITSLTTGRFIAVNESFVALFGYSRDELIGGQSSELGLWVNEAERDEVAEQLGREGTVRNLQLQARTKTGRIHDVLASFAHIELDGEPCVLSLVNDISERVRREREQNAIATLADALRTATTQDEMLPVLLEQVCELVGAGGAAIVFPDPSTDEMVVERGAGHWADVTGLRFDAEDGISGQVMATGEPYVHEDARRNPQMLRPSLLGDDHAIVCLPLLAQDQPIGVLWVGRDTAFGDNEVNLLTAIGDMAANALRRVTLFEQTRRRVEQLETLRTIDMTITSTFDRRVTLNVLLEQIVMRLEIDAAAVLLLDPHTQTLEFACGRGFRTDEIQNSSLRLGTGVAGKAALERERVAVEDLRDTEAELTRTNLVNAEGFVSHLAVPLVTKGKVKGVLELFHRSRLSPAHGWLEFLDALATQAAIAVEDADLFDDLQRSNLALRRAYDATLEGWVKALDMRDMETEGHTRRVTEMAVRLARAMGVEEERLVHVRRGALLHDIGKMGVPDSILLKPGPLDDEEWALMRMHPEYANEFLSGIDFLTPALDIPYCHHEKWDGSGYPHGLAGEQIPLAARIFAVVDVYDALTSDRPYRKAWPEEKALAHIRNEAGTHFDPAVVEAFFELLGRNV